MRLFHVFLFFGGALYFLFGGHVSDSSPEYVDLLAALICSGFGAVIVNLPDRR
jgi:hypothetical protein